MGRLVRPGWAIGLGLVVIGCVCGGHGAVAFLTRPRSMLRGPLLQDFRGLRQRARPEYDIPADVPLDDYSDYVSAWDGYGAGGGWDQGGNPNHMFRGVRTTLSETDRTGRFIRSPGTSRYWIGQDSRFRAQENRYHLYVSLACPWACRCLSVLYLKGLDHVIGISVVHPTWQRTRPNDEFDSHTGWVFRGPKDPPLRSVHGHGEFDCDGCIDDYVNGARTVRELYEMARDVNGKYSVPILWDKRLQTIVNNESGDIMRMINQEFNDYAMNPELDLYPPELVTDIDAANSWVYEQINNGVYRCGFAKSQEAYDEAVQALYEGLDRAEYLLSRQRYLLGPYLTETDIRLFQTLIRFDEVYQVYFKCNKKRVVDYPNLLNYTREIFQLPGISLAVNMKHIRTHYYTSHPSLNPFAIVPLGPHFLRELYRAHDRERFQRHQMGLF